MNEATFAISTGATPPPSRLNQLTAELMQAWDQSDQALLQDWAVGCAATFGTSLARRALNVVTLISKLGRGTVAEFGDAIGAYEKDELGSHLLKRTRDAHAAGTDLVECAAETATRTIGLLRTEPREAVPRLLALVITSLLVSGGPDGDGGAPDLDLMLGIGAHRSIFTHSVIMGAGLETLVLSLIGLVQLIHAKLPPRHDPFWDELLNQSNLIARGANQGVSVGMSYHLIVDGLLQPGAYHGLPFPMSMEAHRGLQTLNGIAEWLDVSCKPAPSRAGRGKTIPLCDSGRAGVPAGTMVVSVNSAGTSTLLDADEIEHKRARSETFVIDPAVAESLGSQELLIIKRYGSWLEGLASGRLRPSTDAQRRFVQVDQGTLAPASEHEQAWMAWVRVGRNRRPD